MNKYTITFLIENDIHEINISSTKKKPQDIVESILPAIKDDSAIILEFNTLHENGVVCVPVYYFTKHPFSVEPYNENTGR